MTPAEIINRAFIALKSQVSKPDLLTFLNTLQQLAFKQDLEAFKYMDNYLTVYYSLAVDSFSTAPVAADVGRTVTQGAAAGTLISYNDGRVVVNKTSDEDFVAGAFTISGGTGAGTLSADPQSLYLGPYSFPSSPPVRKMLGLTKLTDRQLLKIDPVIPSNDYGFVRDNGDPRGAFIQGKLNPIDRTFTFPADPDPTPNLYRWVYFRNPPTIVDPDDSANLLVPEAYHLTSLVPGLVAMGNHTVFEEPLAFSVLEPYFDDYWSDLRETYTPMVGDNANQTSEGQP